MADSTNLKLSVTNFGPIASAEIDLRPLTVFVGPSNTGKSYLAVLIYALHRFFNGYAIGSSFHAGMRRVVPRPSIWSRTEDRETSQEEINTLVNWARQKDLRDPLPDAIAMLIRPLLGDVSGLKNVLSSEIARCFGIEDIERLIRHRTRSGVRIDLNRQVCANSDTSEPFEYSFAMTHGKTEFTASIPEATPLQIGWEDNEPSHQMRRLGLLLDRIEDFERDEKRYLSEALIDCLSEIVGSHLASPLSHLAYYLPADRTGVMHAHRVVVGSLISRASRAGLGRVPTEPVLSGVLADFLGQLIGLGDSPNRERTGDRDLSKRLEIEMLRGAILSEDSDIGYPEFSYQPEGWTDKIPLMNSSSMVSELAPVVLYLRHIVQPGDVLIIEEPESHLHPAMQVEFTRQLAAAVRSGIRVMLTTHSEWVLDELANLIRLSELPESRREEVDGASFTLAPDEVGMWLFEPRQRPKGTVVKEIPLDREIGNFQSGFEDVATGTYNKWATISNLIEESRFR